MNKLAIICGNGSYENPEFYLKLFEKYKNALVVAVDGGYDFLKKINIIPDILIGDFDSVNAKSYIDKTIRVKPEKDETDTRLAIDYLIKNNFKNIIMIGMTSISRLDHTLVNIFLMEKYAKQGIRLILINENTQMYCLEGPVRRSLESFTGLTISFIPLSEIVESFTIQGVKYPLHDVFLKRINPDLTVSNIVLNEESYFEFNKGSLLILINNSSI